jgi:hypothetical protein
MMNRKSKHWLYYLALTYELQLDKDKDQVDKRLLFRESYRSFKKRQMRLSQRVCHDYSLYMKVWKYRTGFFFRSVELKYTNLNLGRC